MVAIINTETSLSKISSEFGFDNMNGNIKKTAANGIAENAARAFASFCKKFGLNERAVVSICERV